MRTAVFAEIDEFHPPYERTTWRGLMHQECAEAHGNRVLSEAQYGDIPADHRPVCLHCNQPLDLKGD
jgi:hypothetical protein